MLLFSFNDKQNLSISSLNYIKYIQYTSTISVINCKYTSSSRLVLILMKTPQTLVRENVEINRVFSLTRLAINAHRVSPFLKCPSTFNSTRFNRIQPIYIYISTGEASNDLSPSTSSPIHLIPKKDFPSLFSVVRRK